MVGFRKLAVWLVLASYLFANTLAASWHDHHDHTACPSTAPAQHCHHHHHHCAGHHDHDCDHEEHDPASGKDQDAPHHCVVCEFLALAPLPATPPALIAAGEAVPAAVVLPVVRLGEAPIQAHAARGPPAAI